MVKAIDNLVTDAPLRDIRLAIGPAEALLRDFQDPGAVPQTTALEEPMTPAPEPASKEQLVEHEQAGYQRGREEAVGEYEAQINHLRAELEQKNAADLPGILGKIETEVNGSLNQRLQSLESELVEFATEAAIRLVNGLPISTKIVESSIQDALSHCENDAEVAVYLNPEDLKLLKEAGSDLLADSPHQRRVRYLKDEEVSRGGCLVETNCGLIDGRRETREQLLREAVDS
jgi:flagellar biosynthesis/type III secretory pathway protein FliH